jgi:hypothetical protein
MSKGLYDTKRYAHMTAASTAINRDGPATLQRVVVNDPASVTLTLYDNPAAAGDVIAVIDCGTAGTYEYGLPLSTGLTAVLSGSADVTIVYQ